MVVIYGNPADYEASKIIAEALNDQLVYVTQENAEQVWQALQTIQGSIILVGGENANPITRKLVELGVIHPLADPKYKYKAIIQYYKENGRQYYVVAGWEREETLWSAKLIEAYKSLPDMEKYQELTGKREMIWDVGYLPKLYQFEFTFITLPRVALSTLEYLVRSKFSLEGYKLYTFRLHEVRIGTLTKRYILTIEVGEPVIKKAGLPLVVLIIIAIVGSIGGVMIAWKVVDIWAKKEEVQLAKLILETETQYQQEKLQLLQSLQQLPPEYQQEALRIIQTTPSILAQTVERPSIAQEFKDIVKWILIGSTVLIVSYGAVRYILPAMTQVREVKQVAG